MQYAAFYELHLGQIRWRQNGEGQARCCFHEDERPSLSVNRQSGVWFCHACNEGGAARQFAERRGVAPPPGRRQDPEAIYVYTDEKSKPLFRVVRQPGKRFYQERYAGPGRWERGIKGVRRVVYRLPEVLKAEDWVIVVEGEKDADALRRREFIVTTNPGGANKWRAEYTESFRGKRVIILGDNDEPGRKHVDAVAHALHGVATALRVPNLMGVPEHGDVSDWFAQGHTSEELRALIEDTPAWSPSLKPPARSEGLSLPEAWPGLIPPEMQGLRLPAGYTVKEGRLYQGEEHVVTYTPILPARILQDLDTNHQGLEVLLLGAGRPCRLQVGAQDLRDVKLILKLTRHGLDVNTLTARDLVRFLSAYIRSNSLERVRQTRKLGWIAWEDGAAYVLHEIHPEGAPIGFAGETEEARQLREALRPVGTRAGVGKLLAQIANYAPVVTALCAAVAPAVREVLALDVKSFILHLEGPSTTGKTLTQRIALSAWANPFDSSWLLHGHATFAGLERLCLRTFGLPVVIEDAHLIRDQDRPLLVYAVGNESWKARGGRDHARAQIPWHGVLITSGELGLLDETSLQGVGARLLTFTGPPFGPPSEDQRRFLDGELVPALHGNHGLLGIEVITYLLQADEPKRHALQKWWKGLRDQFAKDASANPTVARQAPVWALLGLTAKIITEVLNLAGKLSLEDQIWEIFAQASRLPPPDPVLYAYQHVISWAESNRAFFYLRTAEGTASPGQSGPQTSSSDKPETEKEDTAPRDGRPVYGLINERKGKESIAFYPNVLRDILTRGNLGGLDRFLRAWRDRGLLVTRKDELVDEVKIGGRNKRMYVLKIPSSDPAEARTL